MVFHPSARFPSQSGNEHASAPSRNVRHPMPFGVRSEDELDEGSRGQYNRYSDGRRGQTGPDIHQDSGYGGMRDGGGYMRPARNSVISNGGGDDLFNPEVQLDSSRVRQVTGPGRNFGNTPPEAHDMYDEDYVPPPVPSQSPGGDAINRRYEERMGIDPGAGDDYGDEYVEDPQAGALEALAQLLGGGQGGGFDLSQVLGGGAPPMRGSGMRDAGMSGRQQALQRMIQGR